MEDPKILEVKRCCPKFPTKMVDKHKHTRDTHKEKIIRQRTLRY